jgi:Mg2+/Co2+ transporter CorB
MIHWVIGFIACVCGSAFFSATETALMSVNRYRIRHWAAEGKPGAKHVETILGRTDELIALILMGNTLLNVTAASLVTVATLEHGSPEWLAITEGATTLILLLFAEVIPKTWAVVHADSIALTAAFIYRPLLWLSVPVVWPVTTLTRGWLRLMGMKKNSQDAHTPLSASELRTLVTEASSLIPLNHRQMVTGLLDLERIRVEDIMIPRTDIVGIDLNDELDRILSLLRSGVPSRLPVYRDDVNNLIGVVHVKDLTAQLLRSTIDVAALEKLAQSRKPIYAPLGTTLLQQLQRFQEERRQQAYIVDEYGEILGMVTLDAILEEIVGEFQDSDVSAPHRFKNAADGSLILPGTTLLSHLNRRSNFKLIAREARTINGLVQERIENIPRVGTTLKFDDVILEVLKVQDHRVQSVRLKKAKPHRGASHDDRANPAA